MTTHDTDDSAPSTTVVLVVFGILALLALGGTGYWFVSKQQMAVAERARLVAESEALLARARQAQDQASKLAEKKAASQALLRAWQSATQAAREAEAAAEAHDPGGEQHRRARALVAAIEEQRQAADRAAQAERERALIEELADVMVPRGRDLRVNDWPAAEAQRVEKAWNKIFDDDQDLLPVPLDFSERRRTDLAAARRGEVAAPLLARSLDLWALVRSMTGPVPYAAPSADILDVAAALDPGDDLRKLCREALAASADLDALRTRLPAVPEGEVAPASACLLAGMLAVAGNETAALALAERALARAPDDHPLLVLRGVLLERAEPPRVLEARDCWAAAAKLHPESDAVRHRLALAALRSGDLTRARAELGELLRREPRRAEWNADLAEVEHAAGNPKDAVAAQREAARWRPDDMRLQRRLAQMLVAAGEIEPAHQVYRRLVAHQANDADVWHEAGRVMQRLRGYESAVIAFEKALALRPGFLEAQCDLGSAHLDREDLPAAVTALRAALAIDFKHARSHLRLGETLERQNDLDGALAEYRAATTADEGYAEAWCALGALLRRRGRYVESLDGYRRGHQLGSQRGAAWEHPSADWLQTAEKLAKVELRLLPIVEGNAAAGSASELLDVVDYAYVRGAFLSAAQSYAAAAKSDPDLMASLTGDHREKAAFAAALAGCGKGDGAATLDAAARRKWRELALAWLRADFEKLKAAAKQTQAMANRAGRIVRRWQEIEDLALVRDEKALAALPQPEAALWRAFWEEVDVLAEPAK